MIPLTRGAVRSFLAVARRAAPPGRRPGFDPPVRIAAGAGEVTLAAHCGRVVLGRRVPAVDRDAGEEFVVPLDDLQALDGRGDGPVDAGAGPAREAVTARWADDAGPHEAGLPLVLGSPLDLAGRAEEAVAGVARLPGRPARGRADGGPRGPGASTPPTTSRSGARPARSSAPTASRP